MGPFNLTAEWGTWISYLVPLLIGVGFGASLEMSGFGDSRKLAGQFYLKDLTVLKVMFTGIVVAGILIGLFSSLGLLDFNLVFVNPTFLVPGIVGGLIMGVGFIVGGFCPGTSVVAASTLKIDGIFFVGGVAIGIFAFGETVGLYDGFWNSTNLGRFTLPELFHIDVGYVLIGIVAMALFMFMAGEMLEDYFGKKIPARNLRFFPKAKMAWVFGGSLAAVVLVAAIVGQPDADRMWNEKSATLKPKLDSRAVYVHPMEVAELTQDTSIYTRVLDVRAEADYNLFHLRDSMNLSLETLRDSEFVKSLKSAPANTVFFTVSNDEDIATQAWKLLSAQGVQNVYIVEGGINNWLTIYPPPPCLAKAESGERASEELAFEFYRSVGDCCNTAYPAVKHKKLPFDCFLSSNPDSASHSKAGNAEPPKPEIDFERKVKLQKKAAVKGGCG